MVVELDLEPVQVVLAAAAAAAVATATKPTTTTTTASSSMSEYPPAKSQIAEFSLNVGPIVRTALHSNANYALQYQKKKAKKVQHYLLGDVIGKGNFGKVREAIDTRTDERVAIKTLNIRRLRKLRSGEANVRREIAIMQRLSHANVARFIEVIELEEKQKMYIVLELIGGGSLRTLLETMPDARLPEEHSRWYFRQLLDGLEYLHSQGVIHRDIKPSNLMITTSGILKIADFGVAEVLQGAADSVLCSETNGTPSFLSPEIASGAQSASGIKIDVWAVGVTLYAMSTGDMPFSGSTLYELLQNISKGEYSLPSFLSAELASLLASLLEPDANQRFSLESIRSHAWMQIPSGVDELCRPESLLACLPPDEASNPPRISSGPGHLTQAVVRKMPSIQRSMQKSASPSSSGVLARCRIL